MPAADRGVRFRTPLFRIDRRAPVALARRQRKALIRNG
jgi:hypothetical protein